MLEDWKPSEFAERYRHLKEGTTARPGLYSHEGFEFFAPIEDAAFECIQDGRKLVFMKPAQIGGSEAMLNVLAWVATYMPGPTLYMTSTDEIAKEFSKDRLQHICQTCEPLSRKFLAGNVVGVRDEIYWKRFVDGKIGICGGKSINNFQSNPYRSVFVDEADSLQDELKGQGDPIKLAELRTQAYALFGSTFMCAFAHPSTKEHGVGKVYYENSDQRRGFVPCPHCPGEFWLQWDHVKVHPKQGQAPAAAERDPSCYHYFAPCCGAEISDAQRIAAAKKSKQKSTLPPEVAKTKPWIGVHTSHLYTKTLDELARAWIEGIDNPGVKRVVVNKILGDVFSEDEGETADETVWRSCITIPRVEDDPASFYRGEVPKQVSFLTAGTDANMKALHWQVWGWGLMPQADSEERLLCGWLVDWGEVKRDPPVNGLEAQDMAALDDFIYERAWRTEDSRLLKVTASGHDSGWKPNGVYEYARRRPTKAVAVKGGANDNLSTAPIFQLRKAPVYLIRGVEVKDPLLRYGVINTFLAKSMIYSLARRRFHYAGPPDDRERWRLHLPVDVESEVIDQLSAEGLVQEKKKKVWRKHGANHYGDCLVYAYALALEVAPAQRGRTSAEIKPAETAPKKNDDDYGEDREEKKRWKIGR